MGEARDDHDILRGLSRKLGAEADFSGNKSTDEWLEWIYDESRSMARQAGIELPVYARFLEIGWHETEMPDSTPDAFTAFRENPTLKPL